MKKIFQLLLVVAIAAGFAACSDNWTPADDLSSDLKGEIRLSSLGVEVSETETEVSRLSRASSVDISNFIVSIVNSTGTVVDEWKYSEMPGVVTLPVGKYTVKVRSHNVQRAAFDEPLYMGSGEIEIVAGEIKDIESPIVCRLSNIKVSISFSEKLAEMLEDDVEVTVVANDAGTLVFTPDETRAGYFEAVTASTTLIATLEGHIKGQTEPISITRTYTDAGAGKHYRISYEIKVNPDPIPDEEGWIVLSDGTIIDSEVIDETQTVPVDVPEDHLGDDDRPGHEYPDNPDNPDNPDKPDNPSVEAATFVCHGYSFDTTNTPDASKDGKVYITCPLGAAHLFVKIETTSADFQAAVSDLMPMAFDLADPGEYAESFSSIGFPVGAGVIGQTDMVFDITSLAPLLSGFPGTHTFTIRVVDQKGNESSKKLTFVA